MLVSREILDPVTANFFKNATEEELRAVLYDFVADAEIDAAIDYSLINDDQKDGMSVKEFLVSIEHNPLR